MSGALLLLLLGSACSTTAPEPTASSDAALDVDTTVLQLLRDRFDIIDRASTGVSDGLVARSDFRALLSRSDTAPDLQRAAHVVLDTPGFFDALETAAGWAPLDGLFSIWDVDAMIADQQEVDLARTLRAHFAEVASLTPGHDPALLSRDDLELAAGTAADAATRDAAKSVLSLPGVFARFDGASGWPLDAWVSTFDLDAVIRRETYFSARRIATLHLSPAQAALADRADRIPRDGSLTMQEIAAIEPALILFPVEHAMLADLRAALRRPGADHAVLPAFDPTTSPIVDTLRTSPPRDPYATKLPIASLANAKLVECASRIELAFNEDGDASAISLGEVDRALGSTEPFLPRELFEVIPAIADAIYAEFGRAPTSLDAELSIPMPRDRTDAISHALSPYVEMSLTDQLGMFETRAESRDLSDPSATLLTQLRLMRRAYVRLSRVDSAAELVLVDESSGRDDFVSFAAGDVALAWGSAYRLEIWKKGVRVRNVSIALPSYADTDRDLTQFIGYRVTSRGSALHRNFRGTSPATPTTLRTSRYTFDSDAVRPDYTDPLETYVSVPAGRYEVSVAGTPFSVEVYPTGAVRAGFRGRPEPLYPVGNRHFWDVPRWYGTRGAPVLTFEGSVLQYGGASAALTARARKD